MVAEDSAAVQSVFVIAESGRQRLAQQQRSADRKKDQCSAALKVILKRIQAAVQVTQVSVKSCVSFPKPQKPHQPEQRK